MSGVWFVKRGCTLISMILAMFTMVTSAVLGEWHTWIWALISLIWMSNSYILEKRL